MKPFKLSCVLAVVLSVLLCAGCENDPERSATTSNGTIKVDTLFHHEGCTVYRFYDSRTVYYAKCEHGNAQTMYQENCGKNCTRNVGVDTGT